MALTQITDPGVKDDAIKAKHIATDAVDSPEIAANAVGASELADNAVDTNAIQENAVTADEIAENAVGNSELATNAVATGNVQDNAITAPKTDLTMAQGSLVVGTGADTWGTLAKGSAGQVLTMNSGATTAEWSTAGSTDNTKMPLAGGTFTGDVTWDSPTNAGQDITWDESTGELDFRKEIKVSIGRDSDAATWESAWYHNKAGGTGNLNTEFTVLDFQCAESRIVLSKTDAAGKLRITNQWGNTTAGTVEDIATFTRDGSVELYYDGTKRFETTNTGATVTGGLVAGGLTFPTSDGSANQVLKTDGSGALGWTTVASGGKFASYAAICDKKAYDADGGTFSDGAWRTRDLNHEIRDEDSIVSISSDQFTLVAGDYLIRWTAPAESVNRNTSRLYNATDSAVVGIGTTTFLSNGLSAEVTGSSTGTAYVSISAPKAFEIQHYGQTSRSTTGFGMKSNLSGVDSIYTIVEIFKES